jgi:hypothetical protein
MIDALLYVAGYMVSQRRKRVPAAMLLIAQIPYAFLGGRRSLMVGLLCMVLGVQVGQIGRNWLSLRKRVVLALIAGVVFIGGYSYYQTIRDEKLGGASATDNLMWAFSQGYKRIAGQTGSEEDFKKASQYNALTRAFYIGYPAMMMRHSLGRSGSDGEILWLSFRSAIPRILWPSKAIVMQEETSEEYVAYLSFGLPRFQDESNTIITTGFTEFRYGGIFMYVGIMYAMAWLILWAAAKTGEGWLILYAIASEVYIFITIESCVVDWIVLLRNTLLLLVPLVLAGRVFVRARVGATAAELRMRRESRLMLQRHE